MLYEAYTDILEELSAGLKPQALTEYRFALARNCVYNEARVYKNVLVDIKVHKGYPVIGQNLFPELLIHVTYPDCDYFKEAKAWHYLHNHMGIQLYTPDLPSIPKYHTVHPNAVCATGELVTYKGKKYKPLSFCSSLKFRQFINNTKWSNYYNKAELLDTIYEAVLNIFKSGCVESGYQDYIIYVYKRTGLVQGLPLLELEGITRQQLDYYKSADCIKCGRSNSKYILNRNKYCARCYNRRKEEVFQIVKEYKKYSKLVSINFGANKEKPIVAAKLSKKGYTILLDYEDFRL